MNHIKLNQAKIIPPLVVMVFVMCAFLATPGYTQTQPELVTAKVQMGTIWSGVAANGDKSNFNYGGAGFFPNDVDIIGFRGQTRDAWAGGGLTLSTSNWVGPDDSLHLRPIYGPTNDEYDGWRYGKVVDPLTNYIRYTYPDETVNYEQVLLDAFGELAPEQFDDMTCDQIVQVSTEHIFGVEVERTIMQWSQNYHNDYILVDVTFTNTGADTLTDFYINMQLNGKNTSRSSGNNPAPAGNERFDPSITWQHYYGGRVGDSLRIFYEYSAHDPNKSGDLMGAPAFTQNGRLLNTKMLWYSILHASGEPYNTESEDQDDFTQPKVTYIGKANLIPFDSQQTDEFGSRNYYALSGGFSRDYPMSGDTWPETFHGVNSDEMGNALFDFHPAIARLGNDSKMWSTFGPYLFAPGQKLRLVYAVGFSGLSLKTAKEIGKEWLDKTISEPEGIPDPVTGYFPDNFVYPAGSTEYDKIKNRWLSTGIDSVHKSASRAKWNFTHGYKVPQAPPPPSEVTITALGTGVEIKWSGQEAEAMDNFAGYRIMRRISNMDTVFYEPVYDSDETDKAAEHLIVEKDLLLGAQYYYYIQSKARIEAQDPLAYPDNRGKILYSARVLHPNFKNVKPVHVSQDDLSKIRIVPNPYNINDPLLVTYGYTDQRGIQFFNLPAKVTIKIFTEHGDLVRTLEHDSAVKSGQEFWDMLTSNQQVIHSGVYIAVFEAPDGSLSYQKFVVVR